MAKFRKRGVVDAEQIVAGATIPDGIVHLHGAMFVQAPEGLVQVRNTDWIITEPNGEWHSMEDEDFNRLYEPTE